MRTRLSSEVKNLNCDALHGCNASIVSLHLMEKVLFYPQGSSVVSIAKPNQGLTKARQNPYVWQK